MTRFAVSLAILVLAVSTSGTDAVGTQTIEITRNGSRPVAPAPEANFTGDVRVERLFDAVDPSTTSGGLVTFAAGARTAWHSHPGGQILIVTAGSGRVQLWGHPIEEMRTGDVVQIPADVKHWHGASPNAAMTHLGITEQRNGTTVEWMEKVSDEQYNGALSSAPAPSSNREQAIARPSGELQQRIAPGLATLTDACSTVMCGDGRICRHAIGAWSPSLC